MKKKLKARKPATGSRRTPSSKASTRSTVSQSKWIRIDRPFPLPGYVKDIVKRLNEAGHVAYVVGGSVRDFLLGKESKDHDIATDARPDELCRLFPRAVTVGKAFGVLKIPLVHFEIENSGSPFVEVATFREDSEYGDFRHPKSVRFAGPVEDALRRDFTINALFYDPKIGRIMDVTDGFEDLKAGVIRAIGDPDLRFREDALRLIRAVRFAANLGFKIEPSTGRAITEKAQLITKVSAERVRDELTLIWTGSRPEMGLELLGEFKLLGFVLRELEAMKGVYQSPLHHPEGDVWIHTLKILRKLAEQNPARTPVLAWATLLHDVGKPIAAQRSGGKNFNGHDVDGGKIAGEMGTRFKMSRADTDRIISLIEQHLKFKDVFRMREATLQRFIRQPHFPELLALHKADCAASDGNLAYYEFCLSRLREFERTKAEPRPRLITGRDLVQLGLEPGPKFAEILRGVEDLALEKKLTTKEEALEYVVRHFVQ